jgi:hypothetical protein
MSLEHINCPLELIRYIKLVSIEQQDNQISALSKPCHHLGEVITTVRSLLFARQNTWSVNESDGTQNAGRKLRSLESTQEGNTEALETTKGEIGVYRKSVSWDGTFLRAIDENCACVCSVSVFSKQAGKIRKVHNSLH